MPIINKTERVPLCVKVYKQLYDMIKANKFNDKLPGENSLSKELGVSRSTLRQALAFLHDDGLIKNIHGLGNFIIKEPRNDDHRALGNMANPLYQMHQEELSLLDFQFRLELDSQYTQEIFGKKSSAVVSCDRWFATGNRTVAMIFTFLPIDAVEALGVNMHDEEGFYKILNEEIYNICDHSELEIKISSAGNLRYKMPGGEQCILAMESLYKNGQVICHNKIYIPKQFAKIHISRKTNK